MAKVKGECGHPQCPLQQTSNPSAGPTPTRSAWAEGYVLQSRSDFDIYKSLGEVHGGVEECHRLHYLQMACEKIAKAYRLRDTETTLDVAMNSHLGFNKFMNQFLKSPAIKLRYPDRDSELKRVIRTANQLAREIEKLAPAVDRHRSPANTEYPWADGERVVVPCQYVYGNLSMLKDPGGRNLLKLIRIALDEFESIEIA